MAHDTHYFIRHKHYGYLRRVGADGILTWSENFKHAKTFKTLRHAERAVGNELKHCTFVKSTQLRLL